MSDQDKTGAPERKQRDDGEAARSAKKRLGETARERAERGKGSPHSERPKPASPPSIE